MPEDHENAIEWIYGQRTCTVTLWTGKQQNKVAALCRKHPEKVKVIAWPEENGGYLYARIPLTWLKFNSPAHAVMSEEQKAAAVKRLAAARATKETRKNTAK